MAGRQGDYLGQQQQGQCTKHDTNAQQEQDIGPVGFCAGILGALLLDDLDLTLQFAHLITAFAVYMFTLTRWSQSGDVLRMIVTDTPVNLPVLLAPVRYGEQDGTGDVYVTLTMRQYRELAAETTEQAATGNAGRAQPQETKTVATYTVVRGDTMWGIARRYYGDGTLAWKLASYNGIPNANLIYPGQKVTIPDRSLL